MIIKIEIDVKPEELRRFLGLPDVGALQEDMVDYLRLKVGSSIEGFDPAQFLEKNIETGSKAWKKLMSMASTFSHEEEEKPARKPARKTAAKGTKTTRKRSTTSKTSKS